MNKVYLDASLFIALQFEDHVNRDKAMIKWEYIIKKKYRIYVSSLTLDEISYLLNKIVGSKQIVSDKIKNHLLNNLNTKVADIDWNINKCAVYMNFWEKCNLKPRDAMHVFIMKSNQIRAIATLDDDFTKHQKILGIEVI